ncbi:unnamed protein product [Paramecium primaurelia]|uniref:Uncharacterized protein n=1 Tax=Paramecium primaurelia TaxID=5886 RepID=A0A8S1QCB3_PARPR|nr:unnamed protein product [Paramecium primaurelia]
MYLKLQIVINERIQYDLFGLDNDLLENFKQTQKRWQEGSLFDIGLINLEIDENLDYLKVLHIDLRECVIDCNYNQQEIGLFLWLKNIEIQSLEMIKKNGDNQIYIQME